jgi:hypothetical protein
MKMLIRMAEIGMAMHKTGKKFALALDVCIPLISLEQRSRCASRKQGRTPSQTLDYQGSEFSVTIESLHIKKLSSRVVFGPV